MADNNVRWWEEENGSETTVVSHVDNNARWWEEEQKPAQSTVNVPSYKPSGGVFGKSKENWRKIRLSFSGDPLYFFGDDETKSRLDSSLSRMENPDLEKKKWALAAYMSFRYQEDLVYCHENIGLFLTKYFGSDDAGEAYRKIGEAYQLKAEQRVEEPGVGDILLKGADAALLGGARVANRVYNTLSTLGQMAVYAGGANEMGMMPNAQYNEKLPKMAADTGKAIRGVYKKYYEPIAIASEKNLERPEDWVTNSDGVSDWVGNFALALIENIPSITVDAAAAGLGPLGLAGIGASYANDAYYDVSESDPEMSEGKKILYSALIGSLNAIGEKITGGILNKTGKEAVEAGVKRGIVNTLKRYAGSVATESAQETVETIAENGVDIVFDRRDVTDAKSVIKELFRGVPEAAMIGGFTGGIFEKMSAVDRAKAEDRVRGMVDNRIKELQGKENLSEEDRHELETLKVLDDAEDTDALLETVVEEFEKAQSKTDENGVEQNVEPDIAENGNERDLTDEELDDLLIKKSEDAEKRMRLKSKLIYNPQDVFDEVSRISSYFTKTKFVVVENWDGLPFGVDHRGRAFTDLETGDVYINSSKVRPNDVFEVVLHEVIGHKGLRGIIPEAQLDAFLDEVYASHLADEDFQEVARAYFPEKVQEFRDDAGTYYEVVLEDAADQRLAAEEYIAHLAQKDSPKPGWWKQFLNKIRMWWSGTGFGKRYPVTTDQIEALLARAGRRMRKHWWNRRSEVVEGGNGIERSGTEQSGTGDVRFQIIGELGAFGMDGSFFQDNLGNLNTAREMLASGKDAKTIKLATGWEKGGDGKWRMEIPDINMKTERVFGNIREVVEAPVYLDGPLQYYVDAPELFAAYPYLRNIKVRMADLQTGSGAYYHNSNEIRIDRKAMDLPERDKKRLEELRKTIRKAENWSEKDRKNAEFLGIDTNPESIKKKAEEEIAAITNRQLYWYRDILIHEIQHAIQHYEGFAIGSSPEYFEENPVINEEVKEEYEAAVQKEYNLKKELLDERPEFLEDFNRFFELDKVYESDAQIDEQAILDEMDRIDQKFRDAGLGDLWDRYNFAYRELIAARRNLNKGIPPYTAYHRTAGEVEARNAQKRKRMSAEEKRQSLLSDTEDVAEESKIYLFEGGWESEFAEPFTEGQKKHILSMVQDSNVNVVKKILYGGSITRNGHTVYFDGKNSHALKLHLDAPGFHPSKGPVTFEEIEIFLPLALAETPANEITKNKKGKKRRNKVYKYKIDKTVYTLSTGNRGDFKSFYSNKKVNKRRKFAQRGASATGMLTDYNISLILENSSAEAEKNGVLRNFTDGNGIRYSIEEYSESDQRDIVAILQPMVGQVVDLKESEYRKYLLDHGVDIPEEDAKAFAIEAMRANQKLARQRGIRKRDNWLYENYPLFRMVAEVAGDNFMINPEYTSSEGEHFTGSWIAPEFVKYSGPPKKYEDFSSDKRYRNYLAAREKALKNAKGMDLSDIAEAISRKTGRDSLELKEEIKDFFRDLKKKEFYGRYTQWKKDQAFEDQALRDAAIAEWQQQEKFRIEDEVVEILQNGLEVDQEWITQNRAVYKELYRQLFGGKEAPHTPGKRDLEAINAALKQKSGDAAVFAQAYKAAREQLEAEYIQKLNNLKQKILSSKTDAVNLQREALEFAQKHLEKENRQEFTKSIVKLMEYSNVPNPKYPEGRRKAEFDKLLERMVERGQEVRKKDYLKKITKRLGQLGEKVDGGRKVRGLRDIATQKKLNRIIEISRMDAGMVNMEITKYQEVLEQKIGSGESTVEEEYQIAILNMYGNMEEKSADELQTAYNELQLLARTGKNNLLDQIEKRAAQDEFDRNEFWNAVNGMKRYSSTELSKLENDQNRKNRLKRLMDQNFWQSLSLDGILEAVALFSDKENNIVQRVREMAHKADLNKKTMNLRNGEDVQNFLKEILKTDSRFVVSDTIGKWRELKSDTGVFRFVPDPEEKQFKYEVLSVEDARKLLQKHDSGQMELPDYEAEAIRQQLVTFDRKVKYDVPAEYKDGATEQLLKEIEKENNEAESEPKVVIPKPTFKGVQEELQLSQMSALYLKLMWDQKDVKFKMHYNGYSEDTMKQIDSFLLPEVKAFGQWMREQLESDRAKISEVYQEMYFAAFPKNEMYFPAVFRSNKQNIKSGAVDITQNGAAEGAIAYTPGALKVRVYHLNDVVDADALTVFQNHRLVMNHFVSHAPVARKMRSIFLNHDVATAIKMKHGNDAYNELKDGLQDFINGGNTDVKVNNFYSKLYGNAVRTKMNFNLLSGFKQTVGWISYSQEIPIGALLKGMKYAALHPKEVVKTLGHTEYFESRWNGGGNAEMRLLLDQSGKVGSKKEEFFRMLDEKGSLATRSGDAFSVLFGGFAVYKYHYDNMVKRGVSESEARKEALLKWEMATERTQQSSNQFLLNKFQRGSVLSKAFTTFMSNQILLWNNNASSIYKAIKFKDGTPLKKAGMGIGALVLSSLAMSAFDLLREGFDDYDFSDAIWNLLADSVTGFGVVGSLTSAGINTFSKGYGTRNFAVGDLELGGRAAWRQLTNEKAEISDKDYGDAVKILQAAGYIYEPAAHAGAVAREVRKWYRIFNRPDDQKKKRKNGSYFQ